MKEPVVPSVVKADVADTVVRMCAVDMRPFNIVEGEGFAQLANKLIAIGAKYGSVPAADVIPSVSTVSRHLAHVVTTEKAKLLTRLSAVPRFE